MLENSVFSPGSLFAGSEGQVWMNPLLIELSLYLSELPYVSTTRSVETSVIIE